MYERSPREFGLNVAFEPEGPPTVYSGYPARLYWSKIGQWNRSNGEIADRRGGAFPGGPLVT
jgi:hypothetical protein